MQETEPRYEALPEVLGNRGIRPFISGEQGNKSLKRKGTRKQSPTPPPPAPNNFIHTRNYTPTRPICQIRSRFAVRHRTTLHCTKWAATSENLVGLVRSVKSQTSLYTRQNTTFPACMKTLCVNSYAYSEQQRLCSDCACAQADLSIRLAHILEYPFLLGQTKCSLLHSGLCDVTLMSPTIGGRHYAVKKKKKKKNVHSEIGHTGICTIRCLPLRLELKQW